MKPEDRVDAWLLRWQTGEMTTEEVRKEMGEWFCLMPGEQFHRLSTYANQMMTSQQHIIFKGGD